MKNKDKLIERLETHRTKAPEGFSEEVMSALPPWRQPARTSWWPAHGRWIVPAFAGAAVMLLIVFGVQYVQAPKTGSAVTFHFELHAPGADRVELLGTFNEWKSGDIVLNGPDASGHWTASVDLPEGRHEYIFLVDGEQWIADPKGATHRSDGFGRINTVINIYEDDDNV